MAMKYEKKGGKYVLSKWKDSVTISWDLKDGKMEEI